DPPRTVGLPVLGVEEHEIDIRREVQLAAAELAHADHDDRLRNALFAARRAEACRKRACRKAARRADGGIGEGRQRRERLVEIRPAGEITPRDAYHLAAAPVADPRLELRFV